MKIYELSKIPGIGNQPPKEPDYEAIYASGYSAGYEDGYASVPCYKNMYFTIEMSTSGAVCPHIPTNGRLDYRVNGSEWSAFTNPNDITVNMEAGDIMEFRGVNEQMAGLFECQPSNPEYPDAISGSFITYGNAMSLLYGNDFKDKTAFPTSGYGVLQGLFLRSQVTDASNLVLPATTMEPYCYANMFRECTSLIESPALPTTTIGPYCYQGMFRDCTNLTQAPVLPATTLTSYCYDSMFRNCTSLAQAPALPATTLDSNCYNGMFQGCTGLTQSPVLPATTLTESCYSNMFRDCTNLTQAPVLPATTLAQNCYYLMFRGCTSLTQAPVLPATTIANGCYNGMFQGCTGLTQAPVLPATTLTEACYGDMFYNCTNLSSITCLATSYNSGSCRFWVRNVPPTGTFYKHPDANNWPTGPSGIPNGWTVVDAS